MQKLRELGIDLSKIDPAAAAPPMGPKHFCRPGGLYESMVKAVAPYGIRGVIWYQGESDGDAHPETYETLFPALIADWRRLWGRELPFLFVQLAPFERWMQCTGERYGIVRAAQQHTADTVPGTAMAVTTDVGMQYDIHPKKKQPLGRRLALLAENKVYGEKDVLCEAPALTGLTVADGALTLTFAHAGARLTLAPAAPGRCGAHGLGCRRYRHAVRAGHPRWCAHPGRARADALVPGEPVQQRGHPGQAGQPDGKRLSHLCVRSV